MKIFCKIIAVVLYQKVLQYIRKKVDVKAEKETQF